MSGLCVEQREHHASGFRPLALHYAHNTSIRTKAFFRNFGATVSDAGFIPNTDQTKVIWGPTNEKFKKSYLFLDLQKEL